MHNDKIQLAISSEKGSCFRFRGSKEDGSLLVLEGGDWLVWRRLCFRHCWSKYTYA